MKQIIKRGIVLLLVLCLAVQPVMAQDTEERQWCPCKGRYYYFFWDQPRFLEALATDNLTVLNHTVYPEVYRQLYELVSQNFADMVKHPQSYTEQERFYAIWTYLRGTSTISNVVWNDEFPPFALPLLEKYGTDHSNVMALYLLMQALDLDAPRGAAGDPVAHTVTIDGRHYYTDPMDGARDLFLVSESDWAALGREVYEGVVCDTPSVAYDGVGPATCRIGDYTLLEGTGILVDWDASSGETDLVIPDGTTTIAAGVFEGNEDIRSVRFPDGLTDIGHHAFRGCSALERIELPEGLLGIGTEAFADTGLGTLSIPSSVAYAEGAFAGSTVERVTFASGSHRVYARMFEGCTQLEAVSIPRSVTHVGERAFAGCTALTELDLSRKRCELGTQAFAEAGLTSIALPAVSVLQEGLFRDCTGLKTVQLQEGLLRIENVFSGCRSLEDVTIPSTVMALDYRCFLNADGTVCSENLVLRCGTGSAAACYGDTHGINVEEDPELDSLYQPLIQNGLIDGGLQFRIDHQNRCAVLTVGDSDNLKLSEDGTLMLPDLVRYGGRLYPVAEIAKDALKNTSMQTVRLPDYLKTIGEGAFGGSELAAVDFSNCVFLKQIPSRAFEYCQQLSEVTLGEHIKTIGEEAFFCCTALGEFSSGDELETIEASAFAQSGLHTVVLGTAVRRIEAGAFCNMSGDSKNGRTAIYFEGNAPELADGAMDGVGIVVLLRREWAEGFEYPAYAGYTTGIYADGSPVALLDGVTLYAGKDDTVKTVYIQALHLQKNEELRAFCVTYDENGQMLDCEIGYLHAANAYVKGFLQKDMKISTDAVKLTVMLVRYQDGSNAPVTQHMEYDLTQAKLR